MLHVLSTTPEVALGVAGLASVVGRLLLHGPHVWKRRWQARLTDLLLSAASGSLVALLLPALWKVSLSLSAAGLLGFAVGATWGPRGLWRLLGLLGLAAAPRRLSPTAPGVPKTPPADPSGAAAQKVLD